MATGGARSVRDFAQRVLWGERLADKFFDPSELHDDDPGRPDVSGRAPGREAALAMTGPSGPSASFPSDVALADAAARGRALHFFANHELVAIEAMALALLRFPEAPAAFRRTLVTTLREEQQHLRRYLVRMRELGVTFGELPCSGHLWRPIAEVDDARTFLAYMSLTFEQANLDHAGTYAQVFRRHGDETSAAILDEVLADEIEHVRRGVRWFQRWSGGDSLLQAHEACLRPPWTLRRARGRGFDIEARRAAGLPDDYIAALEAFEASRGRAPVVHLFDPTAELDHAAPSGFTPDAALRRRITDLELLPVAYAARDDVVLVRRIPPPQVRARLREAGLGGAELVATDLDAPRLDPQALGGRPIARVEPFGWSPTIARRVAPLRTTETRPRVPASGWPRAVFDKGLAARALRRVLAATQDTRLDPPGTTAAVIADADALCGALARIRGAGFGDAALKAPVSTAGRGVLRVRGGELDEPQRGWVTRTLQTQGAVVVEPWLDRVCDLSLRLTILAPGEVRIDGVGRFLTDARGQYLGAVLGPIAAGLRPDATRFLHGSPWLRDLWPTVAEAVAEALRPHGYVGPVGVDAMLHRDGRPGAGGRLRLRPLVEINPRTHLGHVAHHLARRVASGRVGLLALLRRADLPAASGFVGLATRWPSVVRSGDRVVSGVVALGDPAAAREVLPVVSVAADLAEASRALGHPMWEPSPSGPVQDG